MKIVNEMIVDNVVISEDCIITAMVVNDITIDNNSNVVLVGQVAGSVFVNDGARAVIMGQVGKHVINKGGMVVVMSPVRGEISGSPDSTIVTMQQDRKLPNPWVVINKKLK